MTDKPTIIVTGQADWYDAILDTLSVDYALIRYISGMNYMNTLIDHHAAMILVDGDDLNWQGLTTTPKISPATRRIPLMVITDDAERRSDALLKGADFAYTSGELVKGIKKLVKDYARIPDLAVLEQLDCECAEDLPPLAVEGVKKFNNGEYYPQHDLFEEQWVNTQGPVRDLYRAILQVGVAYYQIERGNFRGAVKMLQRSVQWLMILPDVCQGIDVAQLRQDSFKVRAELERLGEERLDELDRSLLKDVQIVTKGDA